MSLDAAITVMRRLVQNIRLAADLEEQFESGLISEKEMMRLFQKKDAIHAVRAQHLSDHSQETARAN